MTGLGAFFPRRILFEGNISCLARFNLFGGTERNYVNFQVSHICSLELRDSRCDRAQAGLEIFKKMFKHLSD